MVSPKFIIVTAAMGVVFSAFAVYGWGTVTSEELLANAIQQFEMRDLEAFDKTHTSLKQRQKKSSDYSNFLSGLRLLHFGKADAALVRFAPLTPEGPLKRPLMQYTGQALHEANRLTEAENVFRLILQESPEDPAAHRWLGIIYYDLGSYDLAIQHLNALIELDASDFRPYRMLGTMYHDFAQETEAIRAYRGVLERNPPDAVRTEVCVDLANSLIIQHQYSEALQLLEGIEKFSAAEALRGRCLFSLGLTAAAEECLKAAKQIAPDELTVLLLEADLKAAQKDTDAVIEVLQRAAEHFPYEPSIRYQLALNLKALGRLDDAERAMAECRRLDGLTTELSAKNQQALSNPHDPELRDKLAELCLKLGRNELAAMWRNAAAALRNKNPLRQK